MLNYPAALSKELLTQALLQKARQTVTEWNILNPQTSSRSTKRFYGQVCEHQMDSHAYILTRKEQAQAAARSSAALPPSVPSEVFTT